MSTLLQLSGVTARLGGAQVLHGIDLTVAASEVVVLVGPYGSGRTATLRVVAGILPADAGSIVFGGRNVTALPADARARAGLSYVPQGREMFSQLTVRENLRLSLVVHGRSGASAQSSLERVLAFFPALKLLLRRKAGSLSVPQQQQLALARAILTDPLFLILDEPTESLPAAADEQRGPRTPDFDRDYAGEICRAIEVLKNEDRLAILLVDQDIDFCRSIADRFYLLDRGNVVNSGPIAGLTDDLLLETQL